MITVSFPGEYSLLLGLVTAHKSGDIKLSFTAIVVHVANLAKDRSFFPALVVDATDGPHTTWENKSKNRHKTGSQARI